MEERNPKDMKVVFVGRRNAFDWGIIRWLDENYTLCATFFIEEDRFSLKARIRKLKMRVKRRGVICVFNELLFRMFFQLRYGRRQKLLFSMEMPDQFTTGYAFEKPCYYCDRIHKNYWLSKIKEINPDILFSVCTHTIFRPKLFNIPKFGLFMLHGRDNT